MIEEKIIHNDLRGRSFGVHNAQMSTPKKKKDGDRHKPGRQVRVNGRLVQQLVRLADRNATSPTQEVNRAVRELLEREGLWPPSGPGNA